MFSVRNKKMELNYISSQIIKAAITVHKNLGPGLLESVYQKCMEIELSDMGMNVETEVENSSRILR